jgi:hypothetical protein
MTSIAPYLPPPPTNKSLLSLGALLSKKFGTQSDRRRKEEEPLSERGDVNEKNSFEWEDCVRRAIEQGKVTAARGKIMCMRRRIPLIQLSRKASGKIF